MIKKKKLNSGLEIITAPMAGTKTAAVLFIAATGSRFENKDNSGISHFLEHMFFKGTAKRPSALKISSELDRVGGEYNAFTGKEYTGFYVKVESSQLALAMDVLSDMILNSKFAEAEIEREKGVVMEELNMYLDNPLYYIDDLFEQCLYGDTPAGRDTVGDKKSIAGFSREKVLKYFSSQYSAPQSIICLAGNIKPTGISLAAKYFKSFSKKNYQDKARTNDEQASPKIKLHYKKTDQAHLSLGVRALPYGHTDELAVKIISIILGGTMSSRLFTDLRERNGLAYYVRTQDEPYTDSGYLTTRAGVPVDKVEQAVKIILGQYKKITNQLVGADELNKVKQCLIGRTAIHLEASEEVASWYGRQAILTKEQSAKQEILTPEKYFAQIKKITPADIKRVARKIFVNNKLNLAVIGPYNKEAEFKKMLKL